MPDIVLEDEIAYHWLHDIITKLEEGLKTRNRAFKYTAIKRALLDFGMVGIRGQDTRLLPFR